MAAFGLILEKIALLVTTSTPVQRLWWVRDGLRSGGGGNTWFWPLIGLIVLAATVCVLAGVSVW